MSGGVPLESSFVSSVATGVAWIALLTYPGIRHGEARGSAGEVFAIAGPQQVKPDPWLEQRLREKFADFDRELRRIMPRLYRHDGAGS